MSGVGPVILSAVPILILSGLELSQAAMSQSGFLIEMLVYALVVASLVAALLATPMARYIYECMLSSRQESISAAVFGLLTLTTAGTAAFVLLLWLGMGALTANYPASLLLLLYLTAVLAAACYAMLIYATTLKRYRDIAISVAVGAAVSVAVYFICGGQTAGVMAVSAAMLCCYLEIVLALAFQCVGCFGVPKGALFSFVACFRRCPKQVFAGFFIALGLLCPRLVYGAVSGMGNGLAGTIPTYNLCLALAVLINIPCLAIFTVKAEKVFSEKYAVYASAVNNSTYDLIEMKRRTMGRSLRIHLVFVLELQLVITLLADCILGAVLTASSSDPQALPTLIMVSIGVYAAFCMVLTLIVFWYFSDHEDAWTSGLVFVVVTAVTSVISALCGGLYGLPLLVSGISGWTVAWCLLRRRFADLDRYLLCR